MALAEYSKVFERNPTSLLEFGDFSGGEVLTKPPETLMPNELSYAENWDVEEDGMKLVVREGLVAVAATGATITSVYHFAPKNQLLYTAGGHLYKWDSGTQAGADLGALSSTGTPRYQEWGVKGSEILLIATGGNLQHYDGTTLSATTSGNANVVFIAHSRVVIAANGSADTVWSDIGDHTGWTHDSGDPSSSQTLPVGYKDGGDIIAMLPLSKDVVVFKDNGMIYRIIGSSPDWSVVEVARGAILPSADSALALAGDVWFLDRRDGIRSLATTAAYGDVGVTGEGKAVNKILAAQLASSAKIWHLRSEGKVWVLPAAGTKVYVYHYGPACWTHYSLPGTPVDVHSHPTSAETYIAIGQKIYNFGGDTDDGAAYTATVRPRVSREPKPHILVRFQVDYDPITQGNAAATVGSVTLALPSSNWDEDYAYGDTDVASADTDPLVPEFRSSAMTRQVWRSTVFQPEIVVTSGRIRVRKIYLWVKGVSS